MGPTDWSQFYIPLALILVLAAFGMVGALMSAASDAHLKRRKEKAAVAAAAARAERWKKVVPISAGGDDDDYNRPNYWATGSYQPERFRSAVSEAGGVSNLRDIIDRYGDLDTYEANRPG